MPHLGYLFAAYSVIFLVIFFYVVFLWRRQERLEAELRAVEAGLKSLNAARSAPAQAGSQQLP